MSDESGDVSVSCLHRCAKPFVLLPIVGSSIGTLRLVLLVLLISGTGAWNSVQAADGRILSFSGDVRINGQPADRETALNRGDVIRTGPGSSIKIVLADNSVLDLGPNSEIDLTDFTYDASDHSQDTTEIGLVEGTLRFISGLIGKNSPEKISVRAGNSTIGVRGSYVTFTFLGTTVSVDASIGSAIILFTDPVTGQQVSYDVSNGNSGTVDQGDGAFNVEPSPVPDNVNTVAQTIAANPDDTEAIQAALTTLSGEDQALLVAVLNNNGDGLNIAPEAVPDIVTQTIVNIATVNPDAAAASVFVGSVLDPANAGLINDAAIETVPAEYRDSIDEASEAATEVTVDLQAGGSAQETDGATDDSVDETEEPEVEEEEDDTTDTDTTETDTQTTDSSTDQTQTSTRSTSNDPPPPPPPPVTNSPQ